MVLTRYLPTPAPVPRDVPVEPKRTAIAAASIAVACALVVFATLLVMERNLVQAPTSQTVNTRAGRNVSTPDPKAAVPATVKPAPGPAVATKPPIEAVSLPPFSLARSWRFQRLGQAKVKLLRTNTKRSDFDLALLVQGRVVNKRHLTLDQPLALAGADQAKLTLVVINKVTSSRIYGVILDPNATPDAARQIASKISLPRAH